MNRYEAIIKRIDWPQLRAQKDVLLKVIGKQPELSETEQALTGILHLIDSIQDEAAEELGEMAVFGQEFDT